MMKSANNKALLIYIEPTPYILGLIEKIRIIQPNYFDIVFMSENTSQNWGITLDPSFILLPQSNFSKLRALYSLLKTNNYQFIHIAGWAQPLLWIVILFAKLTRTPITVESDTPLRQEPQSWKTI